MGCIGKISGLFPIQCVLSAAVEAKPVWVACSIEHPAGRSLILPERRVGLTEHPPSIHIPTRMCWRVELCNAKPGKLFGSKFATAQFVIP